MSLGLAGASVVDTSGDMGRAIAFDLLRPDAEAHVGTQHSEARNGALARHKNKSFASTRPRGLKLQEVNANSVRVTSIFLGRTATERRSRSL
jgi:hypothetical protein